MVYDSVLAEQTQNDLRVALNNMGYMDATVEHFPIYKKKKVTAIHEAIARFEGLSSIRKALIYLKGEQKPTYDLLKDKEIEVIESLYRRKQKRH